MQHTVIPIEASAPEVDASQMRIAAITPFTSIDYPGKLSAVAFLQGCPWKCLYCQNVWMQPRSFDPRYQHSSWEAFFSLLQKRKGLLDAAVFSGGEPCMEPALVDGVRRVKEETGLLVGLHTGGAYPRRLAQVLPYLSWVGLDVKAPPEDEAAFEKVTRRKGTAASFRACFDLLRQSGVPYEARTTIHPDYLSVDNIRTIAHWLHDRGCDTYALQVFRPAPEIDIPLDPVPITWPGEELVAELKDLFPHFTMRRIQ